MKRIKNLALLILAIYVSSCSDDFLSPEPISAISADSYYSTEAELETGVNNMYDGLQGENSTTASDNHGTQIEYQVIEMRSDNTKTKSSEGEPQQFESFDVQPTNGIVLDFYRSTYNVIFRANTVLENLDVASEAAAAQFEGEAKFVRAYSYFNLVRSFGDIPLVDRVITPAEKEIQFTRVAVNTVYELIVSDLQTAVSNLDNSNTARASKAAAQALLAKVYLTLGNYTEAKSLCDAVIGSGEFSLVDDFQDVFYTERNPEIIFAIEYIGDNEGDSQNFSAEWLNAVGRSSGLNYVTDEAKEALDMYGGNRTLYSYRTDAKQPQFYQVVKYLPNGDDALGIEPTSGDPTLAGNDWIVLRYADVLLMRVEATMAGGAATSGTDALESFNEVRVRAGLDEVSNITKEDLLNERRVELAFENQRLFDLIRMGVANEVLGQFASDNGFQFSTTDLLLPMPQSEVGLSGGLLQQNPGY